MAGFVFFKHINYNVKRVTVNKLVKINLSKSICFTIDNFFRRPTCKYMYILYLFHTILILKNNFDYLHIYLHIYIHVHSWSINTTLFWTILLNTYILCIIMMFIIIGTFFNGNARCFVLYTHSYNLFKKWK